MNIGILTQPLHNNYGGLLQNFALQKVLINKGHEVMTVDLPFSKNKFLKDFLSRIYRKYIERDPNVSIRVFKPNSEQKRIIGKHTNLFIENYIRRTEYISTAGELFKLNSYNFDAYIVGSDQVWRPKYSPNIMSFYLDFLNSKDDVKRISYAASFGVDFWEYSRSLTSKCKSLLHRFDSISVREDSGVKLCKEYFNLDVKCVLDPTLLLEKEDYLDLIEESGDNTKAYEGSLMMYVLDRDVDKLCIIETVLDRLNLRENSVMPKASFSKDTIGIINDCVYPPVNEWLRGFRDSSFVITDSFHGTAFSIIFNKPFIAIGNEGRGLSRFKSLLKMFGLESRLITKPSQLHDALYEPIDYKKINILHDKLKADSFNFLENALKGK